MANTEMACVASSSVRLTTALFSPGFSGTAVPHRHQWRHGSTWLNITSIAYKCNYDQSGKKHWEHTVQGLKHLWLHLKTTPTQCQRELKHLCQMVWCSEQWKTFPGNLWAGSEAICFESFAFWWSLQKGHPSGYHQLYLCLTGPSCFHHRCKIYWCPRNTWKIPAKPQKNE